MPVCKREPVRSLTHATNLVLYLQNPEHPSHSEYYVRPGLVYGELTADNFITKVYTACERLNRSKTGHPGRKLETFGHFFIGRFPDGSFLDPNEEAEYEAGIVHCLASDLLVLCFRHENWETGGTDFNFVVPGWTGDPPRVRYSSSRNIRAEMIRVSDQITEALNDKRRAEGRALIYTMQQSARNRARKAHADLIRKEIADEVPAEDLSFERLLNALEKLGHRVKEPNKNCNYISIVPRGRKKSLRFDYDQLMDAHLLAPVIPKVQNEAPHKPSEQNAEGFELPKDKEVLSILELDKPQRPRGR